MFLSRPYLRPWLLRPLSRKLTTSLATSPQEEEEQQDLLDEACNVKAELSFCASQLRSCQHACHGKLVHHRLIRYGLEITVPLSSLLVLMYANCSAFDDAHACLALLPQPQQNVFTWNFLFKALALRWLCNQALLLYTDMVQHGVLPNKVTFRSMLDACAGNPTRYHIVQLHGLTMNNGFDTDAIIGTALVNLYGKIGSLQDAVRVFDRISDKDVITWTSMMLVYVQHGKSKMAIHLLEQMQREAIMPDRVTFITAITACDNPSALYKGRQIHSDIVENRFESDIVVGTALVSMYGKCGSLKDARTTFHLMAQQNVVTWNALIGVNFQSEAGGMAFHYFHQMQIEGVLPNRETYINFLGGCSSFEALTDGMLAHAQLQGSGIDLDITLGNVLINMYGKCSSIDHARKMFERMAYWDVVSWTAMINVFAQHGEFWDAFRLFSNMHVEGVKPNEYTFVSIISAFTNQVMSAEGRQLHWYVCDKGFESSDSIKNALLNMYARFASIEDAQWIFDSLHVRDTISWSAMIAGFAEHGQPNKALEFYARMLQEGTQPNEISFVNIITACAAHAAITEGRQVHGCIVENGMDSNVDVGNALINMYGKSGSVKDAHGLFISMHERDLVSWNTLLTVFAQCGYGREAVCLFDFMKFTHSVPDNITFSSVLASCSHAGLVEEAWQLFMSVEQDHGILPAGDHYICMVDILGRTGQLSDASMLISFMPVQPNLLVFMALIGACQYHLEVDVGEYAARFLLELDPKNSA
eukprot:c20888_g2_i1 orf=3-2270(-)